MFWVITAVVIFVYIVLGGIGTDSDIPNGGGSPFNCTECDRLRAWWSSLGFWGKARHLGWYTAKTVSCWLC